MPDAVAAGDRAPGFALPSTRGTIGLRELLDQGDRVVLAFYFEDGTPACASELAVLNDAYEMMREFGAAVLAVSADTLESHERFESRSGAFAFALASDTDGAVARAYGVIDDADPRRAQRAVFVIDRDGTVMLRIAPFQPSNLSQVEAIFSALGMEA